MPSPPRCGRLSARHWTRRASQLEGTRSQLESAKGAIRSTEESAVREAAMQALTAVQQSLTTLRSSESRLEANLKELAEIQALKVQLDAKNAVYQARMEAIRQDDSLTEEEKAEQLAAIENDPGVHPAAGGPCGAGAANRRTEHLVGAGGGGRQTVAGDAGAAKRADPPAGE